MKFFVIASNSFTGAHFVNYLLEETNHEVIGVSRSPEYHPVLLPYKYSQKDWRERFRFYQLCVNKDLDHILNLIREWQPEYIVNLAAQGEVRNSWNWPEQWFETNTMATVRLSSALVELPFIKKYVTPSTPEVYGATGENIPEKHEYQPSTPYAVSKLAGDLHLQTLFHRYNFPVNFTRAANLYGIHQQLYRIIPRTIIYQKLGKKLQLHGGGKAVRSFIHARDVAHATYLVATKAPAGEVYHLSPKDESFTIADVVRLICDLRDYPFGEFVEMMDENFGQDARFSMSSEKIRTQLGWKPQVEFKEGVKEVSDWIDREWDIIKELPHDYIHKI